jgi:hypothetical protein
MRHDDRQPDLIDHLDKTIVGLMRRREEEEERQAKLARERSILDDGEAARALLLVDCLAALRLVSSNISVSEQMRIKGVKGRIVAELEKRKAS